MKSQVGLSIYPHPGTPHVEILRFAWYDKKQRHQAMETSVLLDWNAFAAAKLLRDFADALEKKAYEVARDEKE